MAKKTWNEKLRVNKGLPKIVPLDEKAAKKFGPGVMLVPSPAEVDEAMKAVGKGRLITAEIIRKNLAQKHKADITCPLTTGIFVNIAAHASEERAATGSSDVTPYWRTLKTGGELNEKFPGGVEQQKMLLELEGFTVIQKGKRFFVKDFEKYL